MAPSKYETGELSCPQAAGRSLNKIIIVNAILNLKFFMLILINATEVN